MKRIFTEINDKICELKANLSTIVKPLIIHSPLYQAAQKWGDSLAIESTDFTLNYIQLNNAVSRLVDWLKKQKIPRESILFFQETNSAWLIIKLLASLEAKMIACLINPKIDHHQFFSSIQSLVKLNWPNLYSISKWALMKSPDQSSRNWHLNNSATIISTSGSSGFAKGALHSFGNHYYSALGSNEYIPLTAGDAWHLSLPLYHISGLAIVFRCLLSGACMQLNHNEKTTHLSWVNKQLFDAIKGMSNSTSKQYKAILLGGGPINEHLTKKALEKKMPLYQTYGMTEMSSQVYTEKLKLNGKQIRTEGRILSHRQLKINVRGEIFVKGECLFQGYIKPILSSNIIQTEQNLDKKGWFSTLDLGEWGDDKKWLKIIGRKDNMFISRGENIQPEMIEKTLLEIKGVEAVLVLPVPHPSHTNSIHAFIKHSSKVSKKSLIITYQSMLPKYLWPERVHPWPHKMDEGWKLKRNEFYQWLPPPVL